MLTLPLDPSADPTPDALLAFLTQCQAASVRDGHGKLASISLAVDALDPLAVLNAASLRTASANKADGEISALSNNA